MRTADNNLIDALENAGARGLVTRALVSILAKNLDTGDPERFSFWNDLDTLDMNVIDAATGNEVNRTYEGGGSLVSVGKVSVAAGLNIKDWEVTLSALHDTVALMVRGHAVRLAQVEFHRAVLDPASRQLVSAPAPHFFGLIDDVDLDTPAISGEGGVTLVCAGQTIELTRANHARRSDATYRKRNGDRIGRYLDIMGTVNVPWGQESDNSGKKNGGVFGGGSGDRRGTSSNGDF